MPSFMDEDLEDLLLEEETQTVEVEMPAPEPEPVAVISDEKFVEEEAPPEEPVCEPVPEVVPEAEVEPEVIMSPRPPTPPSPTVELPLPEPCPIHPVLCSMAPDKCGCARTHCKCAHQLVTLKGSEVMLWADFSELEGVSSMCDAEDVEPQARETLALPSTVEGADYLACRHPLESVNKLRIVAVDQVDPELTCEVLLPAARVAELLSRACTASSTNNEEVQGVEGIVRVYSVPASGAVLIDLMQHPALRRLCFDFICEGSMLDLFLSRKSNLMKLIVKT